ncbi:hypothetical protein [Pseudoalteromonas ostreae]|uniref:hypothetical protein n=1 Tax=Pseudoalteromonas ostreae TaxID=2774154 RepID=UPI001B38D6E5|nr:hypothetical protein [Pseudoalteromonas ostreae]
MLAASWGLGLFCVSYVLVSLFGLTEFGRILGGAFKSFLNILMPEVAASPSGMNLIAVYLMSIYLGFQLPKLIASYAARKNLLYETWEAAAKKDSTPEFSSIMFSSWKKGLPIAFTLSNSKVYIGYIVEAGIDTNDLNILPLVSGYRDDDKKDLIYLIDYKPVIAKIQEHEGADISQFLISIPQREIVHANLHNFDYKNHFDDARYDRMETTPDESN